MQLALNEWKIVSNAQGGLNLKTFLEEKFQDTVEGEGPFIVTIDGYEATITTNGVLAKFGIGIRIGDKVAYNEGSGYTSTIDSNFIMKDLDWRVLDIEDDGTIELISTQPTDSTLTLSGENDWLNAEKKLDNLCNELYGKGTGASSARSLKVDDIDKLAGITTDAQRKECLSSYGSLWRYKYNSATRKIQYSISTNNGASWSQYEDTRYVNFKAPGEQIINSTNYQYEANGAIKEIISEQTFTYYEYNISKKIPTMQTSDGILISSLITNGLNDNNNMAMEEVHEQWLSSRCVACYSDYVAYSVRCFAGGVGNQWLYLSYGGGYSPSALVRPVIILKPNVQLTKDGDTWKIVDDK